MNFTKLETNIIDVIKESQIKLGFQKETIRLYYPLKSLNKFLESSLDIAEMKETLDIFCGETEHKFGKIEISNKNERFCFKFPPETSVYVHENTAQDGFMYDLINCVATHGTTMEQVFDCFRKYSDKVHIEKVSNGEFDYLVYFENGSPDDYRYCLTDEGCHVIYHRYTKDDYDELML